MIARNDFPDATDWLLLEELQRDGRLSFNELARRINLSAPAVAERVRRLEQTGVITGYHAHVDPSRAGRTVEALIDRLADHGQPSSTMVLSSPLAWRPVQPSR